MAHHFLFLLARTTVGFCFIMDLKKKKNQLYNPCNFLNIGSAHLGFDSILLICGIIGIPVNMLLVLGVITVYNPAPAAPAT